ncbi:hypothetical protein SAMN05444339_1237 [Loktanella atrilutea]|uniref:Uncharacterized protein n=1 Tax=Loktanella atrilutea TaxID=366533 RepID=A0A1M5FNI3_LOKAT|nr:hypothetical protein [Loktanella atrilutea]SHF93090.1 hypothetical protein SAMN05444339_1237 [Loktanella atrilutea]
MRRALTCRWLLRLLAMVFVLALILFAIGRLGLFGAHRDPLSAVFLIPLGLPWVLLSDRLPDPLWPIAAALAPLLNLALLARLCPWTARRDGAASPERNE